jgi:glyoxylase-like metal-dependent hydrolase (beta-lactamase superfamily II)
MLEIPFALLGQRGAIHPSVIWDADSVVLVDTGVPGSATAIREECARAGVPYERLSQIILTHDDLDHIAGLGAVIRDASGPVEVLAHAADAPNIEAGRPGKMTPERLAALPEERRRLMEAALERLRSEQGRVTHRLSGGERLPQCGGLWVIHTPGHTLGHICLYHEPSRTLIAGDALNVDGGVLRASSPAVSHDAGQALASLRALAAFDIAAVICYHGGLYQEAPNEHIARLWPPALASE